MRFEPQIQRRYEAEHSTKRLASLRANIVVGLVFYNMYNLTAITLMPDILWLSVFLRLGLVTSISVLIAWVLGALSPARREQLVLFGVMNAYLIPAFMFWLTQAPLGNYSFGELPLHLMFGNMLLALRFRYALVFTGFCFITATVVAVLKSDVSPALELAFVLQSLTACTFAIYANYQIERRRCLDYLNSLQARLNSAEARRAEQHYRDLSLTDPLTGLMNRRALDQQIQALIDASTPVALLMIDVDYFKSLNDTEGHTRGDDILASLANCLKNVASRFQETHAGHVSCARFGGEEFVVMADIERLDSARLARDIVNAIRAAAIPHPARPDALNILTVSIGVACMTPQLTMQPIDLLVSADTALYEAKRLGRDRIVSADTADALESAA
ncbi:diguanylate cyclase [Salinisphaera sp. Q1T1-3]|uniref:GGDEF domain-containing protein n=1 Tax=Salinisphaera sp. Q1T1-3 TaxID=2321229 RepID=UPI001F4536F0|nr:GGDEF domain-containing protein [Salinisphaera sp. Q1T1-3]